MKILYAIQATGNGHLSRARDIYPELLKYGEVDILISGYQADVDLPFPVRFRLRGLSFIFGKKGGISIWATIRNLRWLRFIKDVYGLATREYDLIVSDFEPVSAWAARLRKHPNTVALSHQAAVLHPGAPQPSGGGFIGKLILKYYAPCREYYGFHFERYDKSVYPPVIRQEVRALTVTTGSHYLVYLPAYDDKMLIRFLNKFKDVNWEVFSKHSHEAYRFENISIQPIQNEAFLRSMASCKGAFLGAGFEGPAEALYLNKKLIVLPMKGQYEQQCNAQSLAMMGIPVIRRLSYKEGLVLLEWLQHGREIQVSFPRETACHAVHALIIRFLNKTAQAMYKPVPQY